MKEFDISSKKIKQELPHDPTIYILGIYSKELKTCLSKNLYTEIFIDLFLISQKWNNPKLKNWWLNKENGIAIMEY